MAGPSSQTGSIQGTVTDSMTGTRVVGALVRVDGTSLLVYTLDDGTFRFEGVSAGAQWLDVSLSGYGRARPRVVVRAGQVIDISVALVPGAAPYLETVDVRPGSPGDAAAPSARTLDASELDALRGVLADDPFRAVHALPGVSAADDFRSEFSIRGSDSRHLGMSMDGIAIPWPLHAVRGRNDTGSIAVINSDALDRLTVASGSYAQRSGTRTGGWIDFSLREGSRKTFDARAAASVTNASVLAEGPLAGGRGAWLATVRRSYLNWLLHQIDPDTDAAALGFLDHQSRVVFDLSQRHQLQLAVIGGRAGYDEHDDSPGANSLRDADSHTVVVTTGLKSTLALATILQRVGYVSQGFENTGEFSQPLGDGRIREWIYNITSASRLSPRLLLEGSFEVRQQDESRVLRSFVRQGEGVAAISENAFAGSSWLPSTHVQLTWTPTPAVTFSPGARVTYSSLVRESTVSPWTQVMWRHRRVDVRFGAGAYPQFPEFDQVLGAAGTRTLGVERATHVDLAIGTSLGGVRLQAAGYYRRERDMIRLENAEPMLVDGRIVTSAPGAYQNALDGSARGVELTGEGRLGQLSGWVSYGYGRANYTDRLTGEHFWGDYDQRHVINIVGRYRLSNTTAFAMTWRYGTNVPVGGYYVNREGTWFLTDRRNVSRFPTYSRVDLRADREFAFHGSRVTLYAEVVNLFDRTNLGPADPSIRARTFEAVRVTETLLPRVPAVGVSIAF
jgi:hypothetical protein